MTLALALALAVVPLLAFGQGAPVPPSDTTQTRTVFVLNADSSSGDLEREVFLFGNVRLRQDSTYLGADRVVRYPQRRVSEFYNNVVITSEGDTLRARAVIYDEAAEEGEARGSVQLTDGDVRVLAPLGRYFVAEDRATFDEGVTLIDSSTTLKSQRGTYFTEEKRAEFEEDVQLFEDRTRLEADTLTLFRETDVSIARGHVFLERLGEGEEPAPGDSLVRTLLFGGYVYNDEPGGTSRVLGGGGGEPLLVQVRADSAGAVPDTFVVAAERLTTTRQDSLQRLTAVGGVRVWQKDLAATADSLVYDRIVIEDSVAHEEIRLFGTPDAWADRRQLSGDSLQIVRGDVADTLFVNGTAFLAEEDSTLGRIQQLQGGRIVAVFADDDVRALHVGPNAELIRFRAQDGALADATQASGDTLDVFFTDGEIQKLSLRSGVQSTVYDAALVPADLQLSGFRWTPDRRPTKEALLDDRTRDELPPPADATPAEPPAALPSPAAQGVPPEQ